MSKRLYYESAYLRDFEANIVNCIEYNGRYGLLLDQTCFYPEGGGQPSDIGYIGECEITEVIEKEDQILHITDQGLGQQKVKCKINWKRRYDFMQQHTGQHILSHCFLELFNGKTDSFHLSTNTMSIEIDIKDFDQNRCNLVEDMANEIIYRNLPITTMIVDEKELQKLPLRKHPSVKDNIRIVKIGDIDYSPCGGTHVMSTGEVGIIKITNFEKLKESYRFEFLCGNRALGDYRDKNRLMLTLGAKFSVRYQELDKAVEKLINEHKNLSKDYASAKKALLKYEAEELFSKCKAINGKKILVKIFEDRKADEIKLLSSEIANHNQTVALFGVLNDSAQVIFTRSDDIDINMNSILKEVLPIINGKGGGNSKTAQGGGSMLQNLNNLMEEAYRKILHYYI
ncbi:alanyl-tRNA editing protein [Lutispora saccharofermentans]|uniref:DHHA1 domain-containing protein n=1 Tax=Lutispora saccharofermentans TaxID=3024236 RepID=A0ABT1NGF9_9FIRM|nr:DHHA1 domain-containing protein [Lutispora saccharofermentans]MCQ1530309.1 DHHA1 domain-containing protein [Lutispora saccharofermentans]